MLSDWKDFQMLLFLISEGIVVMKLSNSIVPPNVSKSLASLATGLLLR